MASISPTHPAIKALVRDLSIGLVDLKCSLSQLIDARPELLVFKNECLPS